MNARVSDVLSVGQIGELLDEYLALDVLKKDELYGELSAIKTRLVIIAIIVDKPDGSDEQSTSLCNDLRKGTEAATRCHFKLTYHIPHLS